MSSQPPPEQAAEASLQPVDKKFRWADIKYSTILYCYKFKKRKEISLLEYKALRLKSKFGADYLDLVGDDAPVYDLKDCLGTHLSEFTELQQKIKQNNEQIKEKEIETNNKIKAARGIEDEPEIPEVDELDTSEKQVRWKSPSKFTLPSNRNIGGKKKPSPLNGNSSEINYDSDSGNTAELSFSESGPQASILKGPDERRYSGHSRSESYDSDGGNTTGSENPERRRKKRSGKRNKTGSIDSSSPGSNNSRVVTTTTTRPKRKSRRPSGQRQCNDTDECSVSSRNSRVVTTRTRPKQKVEKVSRHSNHDDESSVSTRNSRVVTTTTRPKRKVKKVSRNSNDDDESSVSTRSRVVTTRTRPKVKKAPVQ